MVLVEEAMSGSRSTGYGALGLVGGRLRGDGVSAAHGFVECRSAERVTYDYWKISEGPFVD